MPIQTPVIDWNDQAVEELSVSHRTPRFNAWMQGFSVGSNGWLNKNFYNYCYGDSLSNFWLIGTSYNLNDTAILYDGVYISTWDGVNIGNIPNQTSQFNPASSYIVGNSVIFGGTYTNPIYWIAKVSVSAGTFNPIQWIQLPEQIWYKISPSYIGAQERAQYNAQKLLMEYALNRWFRTNIVQPTSFRDGTVAYTVLSTSILGIWYLNLCDIFITTVPVTYFSPAIKDIPNTALISDIPNAGFSVGDTIVTSTNTTYQFIVWIPNSLATALGVSYVQIISQVVNKMRLVGTSFSIQIYT